SLDGFQLRLEGGRFLAIGMAQSLVARRELDDVASRLGVRGLYNVTQDLAVALRRDRQTMLEIPGWKTAFVGIITKFDLALFQRLAIGGADDRQQHPGPRPVRQ